MKQNKLNHLFLLLTLCLTIPHQSTLCQKAKNKSHITLQHKLEKQKNLYYIPLLGIVGTCLFEKNKQRIFGYITLALATQFYLRINQKRSHQLKKIETTQKIITDINHLHKVNKIIIDEYWITEELANNYREQKPLNQEFLKKHLGKEKIREVLEYVSLNSELFYAVLKQIEYVQKIISIVQLPYNDKSHQKLIDLQKNLLYWAEQSTLRYIKAIISMQENALTI